MDKKNLYVKNEKGRYELYKEPEPPFNNVLYRRYKRGDKNIYVPQSMLTYNDLDEGVWVVTKHRYGKSYSTGRYLNDCFMLLKASDIQETPLSKLGGMEKLASWLSCHWDELPKGRSQYEFCCAIVKTLFDYEKENNKDGKGK